MHGRGSEPREDETETGSKCVRLWIAGHTEREETWTAGHTEREETETGSKCVRLWIAGHTEREMRQRQGVSVSGCG